MVNYYDKLKKYFISQNWDDRVKELENIKNNQVEVIKMYNKWKHKIPHTINEVKSIIKEEIITTLKEERFKKGTDIGKKGKGFAKVAKTAGKEYDSKEAGKRVAGAILKKVLEK